MSTRPLVIIHGWSDSAQSFRKLANTINIETSRKAKLINLGNYISMDDNLRFVDLSAAMMAAWKRENLPLNKGSVDVITHSMGALVVRQWLQEYFTDKTAPIKNWVMLAPANFGSSLAHKGRAFYGRMLKGLRGHRLFHVGANLLNGLELASPFTWDLAIQDRFAKNSFYGPGKILCTVLMGNTGYRGISAAANENGSDGTVYVACANMQCAMMDADFYTDVKNPTFTYKRCTGRTAFAVVDGENHSTIAAKAGGFKNQQTWNWISRGLSVDDKNFGQWCRELDQKNNAWLETVSGHKQARQHAYQNIVFSVSDQFGFRVPDYFVEFSGPKNTNNWLSELFHEYFIESAHTYQKDNSYRAIQVNCTSLHRHFREEPSALNISLNALPELVFNNNVGYPSYADGALGALQLSETDIRQSFAPFETILINCTLRREQRDHLFTIKPLSAN